MMNFKYSQLTIVLLTIFVAGIDGVRHRYARQATFQCPTNVCDIGAIECMNGGTCLIDSTTPFCARCSCPPGFTGTLCDSTEVIQPSGCNPGCQNGGICNGNMCSCPTGFVGSICETSDLCTPVNPCLNGGRCTTVGNRYVCNCTGTGHTGLTCNERIPTDPCASQPCQNSGRCTVSNTGQISCLCASGFSGTYCQIQLSPCYSSPCLNTGTCDPLTQTTFKCTCTPDFIGQRCETSILTTHPCTTMESTTCRNGGTCTINASDYICNCAVGWSGRNCEIGSEMQSFAAATSCTPNPCNGHGTCVSATVGNAAIAICNCDSDWTGKFCDTSMTTTTTGTVVVTTTTGTGVVTTTTGTGVVTTTTGTGVVTTTRANLVGCYPNPCKNSGVCYPNGNSHYCYCISPYTGQSCETQIATVPTTTALGYGVKCTDRPCRNEGICYPNGNNYFCACKPGYTGKNCEIPV